MIIIMTITLRRLLLITTLIPTTIIIRTKHDKQTNKQQHHRIINTTPTYNTNKTNNNNQHKQLKHLNENIAGWPRALASAPHTFLCIIIIMFTSSTSSSSSSSSSSSCSSSSMYSMYSMLYDVRLGVRPVHVDQLQGEVPVALLRGHEQGCPPVLVFNITQLLLCYVVFKIYRFSSYVVFVVQGRPPVPGEREAG